jgi:hypothetical protein
VGGIARDVRSDAVLLIKHLELGGRDSLKNRCRSDVLEWHKSIPESRFRWMMDDHGFGSGAIGREVHFSANSKSLSAVRVPDVSEIRRFQCSVH